MTIFMTSPNDVIQSHGACEGFKQFCFPRVYQCGFGKTAASVVISVVASASPILSDMNARK
jgi:hypothetical protein